MIYDFLGYNNYSRSIGMLNVKTDENYGLNSIVNSNDIRGHILNIDSRFRKTMLEPPTDFLFEFAHPYKNVIRARIGSVEIPDVCYNFSGKKKNTMFRLDGTDYVGVMHNIQVSIIDGHYTKCQLIETIQGEFNGIRDMYGLFFRITLDERTQRVTIHHDGSAPPPCPVAPTHCPIDFGLTFVMIGLEERRYDFGLGANLGFTEHMYIVKTPSITSESVINIITDRYYLLGIDDMYTVEHKTDDSYIQCFGKILIKRTSEGLLYDDGYTVLSNEIIFPRPMDMKQVRVRLLDMYGEVIDIHHTNMSLSLEVMEVMNVQLYDTYRNYLWTKGEPRVTKHINGSANGLTGRNFN